MANKIQLRRGLKANLPNLNAGEPAFTTDSKEFYVGNGANNTKIYTDADIVNVHTNSTTKVPSAALVKADHDLLTQVNDNFATFYGGGTSYTELTDSLTINVPSTPIECIYLLSLWSLTGSGLYLITKLNGSLIIKDIAAQYGLNSITSSGITLMLTYSGLGYRKWSLIRLGF